MNPDTTLVSDVVRRSVDAWPDRVAVQDDRGELRLSYRELWSAVEQRAVALRRLGLSAGDRVLLSATPGPWWIASFLAISRAGLIAVPVPQTTPASLIQIVAMFAGIRIGVGDRANGRIRAAVTGLQFVAAADLGAGTPEPAPVEFPVRDASSTAVLVFTSGSTARPRAVALTHAALRANLRSLRASRQADPDETVLSTLPASHAYELVAGQLAPLGAGARIVYAGAPLPNRLVDTIRTQSITRMMLVPALLEALVREVIEGLAAGGAVDARCRHLSAHDLARRVRSLDAAARADLRAAIRARIGSSFRVVTVGGAAAGGDWVDVLAAAGVDLDVGYGLTEAGPVVSMGRASECPAGSAGRALPGVDIRMGPDNEVLVRTGAVMKGYAGDDAATAAAFDGEWLRTGDRGQIDRNGFLFITGRIKEAMVTASGETIYPDEIEPFYASPLFAEFAVVPVTGADGNDEPTLIVVPAAGDTRDDAIRHVVASLRAAAPARLRVCGFIRRNEPLPRTAVGKIRRRHLAVELQPAEVLS